MEATGHYWMNLYYELTRRGYTSAVLNPIQTRAKFNSRLRKSKTDKLDAFSIASVFRTGELKTSRIPSPDTFALRLLARQRWRLVQISSDIKRVELGILDTLFPEYVQVFSDPWIMSAREVIREMGAIPRALTENEDAVRELAQRASRGQLSEDKVSKLLVGARETIGVQRAEETLKYIAQQNLKLLEYLEAQRGQFDEELERRVEVMNSPLKSLKLGPVLIATIHAESDPITDFPGPKQFAAYTGLDPSTMQSGNFLGTRAHISKRGSPHLRRALYLGAAGLARHNSVFKKLYLKHRKKGRHHTDVIVILAHKLARITWRLLKDERTFKIRPPNRMAGPGKPKGTSSVEAVDAPGAEDGGRAPCHGET